VQALTRSTLVAAVLIVVSSVAHSQDWLSAGLAAGVPGVNGGGNHAMATLEVGPVRFPVRFRADLAVVDYAVSGPRFAQFNASFVVPFVDRTLSPYLIAGIALAPTSRLGGTGTGGEGLRGGVGLRYRVAERVIFLESSRHWGLNRSQLSLGVQF
jgi:hypothetical protein